MGGGNGVSAVCRLGLIFKGAIELGFATRLPAPWSACAPACAAHSCAPACGSPTT